MKGWKLFLIILLILIIAIGMYNFLKIKLYHNIKEDNNLIGGCAGVQDIYWQECCNNWAVENNFVHAQCVGNWTVENNQCQWVCSD